MEQPLMTVKQAAVQLGLTTRTVRTWIESGRLPGERVEGKFGPEWRLSPEDVERAAGRRTEEPVALDLARRPGGNDLRAIVSVLDSELRKIQERQIEHTKYMLKMSETLERLTQALPAAPEDVPLQGLIRQGSQLQQSVEEEARARHREPQELQASLQTLNAALHDQADQVAQLAASLTTRSLPWYRRLFRTHT